jgi:ATP-dependent helicase/nuclease subunit A
VGDVKQAIYSFRGSKSHFFSEKFTSFASGEGSALRLSNNFRSSCGVLDFVNGLFSRIMTGDGCGIDYIHDGVMIAGGGYEPDYGKSEIHVFGKDENEDSPIDDVYSVQSDGREVSHTREGLAVLEIVERELKSKHYDLKKGEFVDTQPGDICILTRKKSSASVVGIVRTLTDAGYSVSGAQESNICSRPEVKEMLDILSYIDNPKQDIAMTTTMLSPIGGFSCDELAKIRIAFGNVKGDRPSFAYCCEVYAERMRDEISQKLADFYDKSEKLRSLADIMPCADLIDIILESSGLEGVYSSGGGEKLKSILRLSAEAGEDRLTAFLNKLKESGYSISSPSTASSDSIKIMTMHASKGLEFPVVILSDICATFKGRDYEELPVDDVYLFAPKYFDSDNMVVSSTILRELIELKEDRDELNCELNLFYVACTRAMCNLHIMAKEVKPFSPITAGKARSYSQLFDISKYPYEVMTLREDFSGSKRAERILVQPDKEIKELIESKFMKGYFAEESVNLPVKSSASALLKLNAEDEFYRPTPLFAEEGDTGTEKGIAYHRFLELCDFTKRDKADIKSEIESFLSEGKMDFSQADLLDVDSLVRIVNMPIFERVAGCKLLREQEFLCRLPANKIFDTSAEDGVLVQGAIDLLALSEDEAYIIDYKYSKRDDEELIKKYSRQLQLYADATKVITGRKIVHTAIVNIFRQRQITLF